ncbi:MAG TPA: tetratricopeptide repeat protein [Gemmatimonadaceae bacterium]|nr:tetratricopeptide repeat protein [Gemmatimonadaceae bacterium]
MLVARSLSRIVPLAVVLALSGGACALESRNADGHTPEAVSLLGTKLFARVDSGDVARADSLLAAGPPETTRLIEAGNSYAAAWRFNEAVQLYTRAIEAEPANPLPYRFRGHRYISLRRFDDAIEDLERASSLDTLSFDIAYHLGLAHYLTGHWDRAADVYRRCLSHAVNPELMALERSGRLPATYRSCMRNATHDDSRVAMTDWYYRTLRRGGRDDEAATLLASIEEGMSVTANESYYNALLFYKGLRSDTALLAFAQSDSVRFSTAGYALGAHHLVEGDTAAALQLFDRISRGGHWPGFGVIAAEVELTRLGRRRR